MLKHLEKCQLHFLRLLPFSQSIPTRKQPYLEASPSKDNAPQFTALKIEAQKLRGWQCDSRRRAIYDDADDDEDAYGYNEQIAMLETYTLSVKDEVLSVKAMVDEEKVEVLIFKGFSSCLSYETSPDPMRSVLPKKALIESIDRIRGPFNPSDIQYIEKGLTFDDFKNRFITQNP